MEDEENQFHEIVNIFPTDMLAFEIIPRIKSYDVLDSLRRYYKWHDPNLDPKHAVIYKAVKTEIKKRKREVRKLKFKSDTNTDWRNRIQLLKYCVKRNHKRFERWERNGKRGEEEGYTQGFLEIPNINLEGANLSNMDLSKCRFVNGNFKGAYLEGVDLSNTQFIHGDFTRASLQGANLDQTWFTETNLSKTDFREARISDSEFTKSNFYKAKLMGVRITNVRFSFPNCKKTNFSNSVFKDTIFANNFDDIFEDDFEGVEMGLEQANFRFADLEGMNLQRMNLEGANFERANLKNVDFMGANLKNADFIGADCKGAKLEFANIEGIKNAPKNLVLPK
jgi:uncharacterized protein YjbI with pentapeptide repeats